MFRTLSFGRGIAVLAVTSASLFASGCNSSNKVIDHVSFQLSPDGQTVSVALVFANSIQSDMQGTFPINSYGDIFMQPYSATQPFELGFQLNTSIGTDTNYIHLTPTSYLPNGVPLGLSSPLVEVQSTNPISSSFNLAAYVDVQNLTWFGAAASFNFINNTSFPPGMAVTAAFDQNAAGAPGILAYVYGASLNADGTVKSPGGIAVLANVKQLAGIAAERGGGIIDLNPTREIRITGDHAAEFASPESLDGLQEKFIRMMNEQR